MQKAFKMIKPVQEQKSALKKLADKNLFKIICVC